MSFQASGALQGNHGAPPKKDAIVEHADKRMFILTSLHWVLAENVERQKERERKDYRDANTSNRRSSPTEEAEHQRNRNQSQVQKVDCTLACWIPLSFFLSSSFPFRESPTYHHHPYNHNLSLYSVYLTPPPSLTDMSSRRLPLSRNTWRKRRTERWWAMATQLKAIQLWVTRWPEPIRCRWREAIRRSEATHQTAINA